jgi:arsenite oxidase small subunit
VPDSGQKKDIVAFNQQCTHMGGPLDGTYKPQHQVLGPCPLHLTTFDLTRHGMVASGHATESLPQIVLEIKGDDIYAVGVMGLVYGYSAMTTQRTA